MQKELKVAIYSSTGTDAILWSKAISGVKFPCKAVLRSKTDLFDSKQEDKFLEFAEDSDVLIVLPHGGLDNFPKLKELIERYRKNSDKILHIQPVSGSDEDIELSKYSTGFGTKDFDLRLKYILFGGVENLISLLTHIYNSLTGEALEINEPLRIPTEGIYHPDLPSNKLLELDEYLKWARAKTKKDAPIIGIWFYQVWWANKNLGFIDCLIKEIEKQGAIPLAVFHNRFKDEVLNNLDAREVVERFFKKDGKTIIDCLLSTVLFSLTLLDETLNDLYPGLDCPVLQLIPSFGERSYWESSLRGLSPMDISISVAQPEFDGLLITTVTATRELKHKDPITGAMLVTQEPVKERIKKVVSLAINWVKLRNTANQDKKIAIIFHHYPPRSDQMGCAFGLDSFKSVSLILKKLKEEGYKVERLPDSEELSKELLSCQINDRRYLDVKSLFKRSVDQVPKEIYDSWVKDLPQKTVKELKDSWGDPPGKFFSYKDKSLIGGIINGNIFIGLQPPRGHLEKLEENPEVDVRNIHDPDLPPTYHYLFFYRWIKHIFGAHAVIHVGKHGSLEWLPGKAIGLCCSCYPDLSIMDIPNLYPYIVNDPGEGTQAKRRSYAVILDHLIPPQARAGKSEALISLENILEKIYQARMENPSKLPIFLDELWDKTLELNLDKDLKIKEKPDKSKLDEFCEKLHGYINQVADSNINLGLHILGLPPKKERFFDTLCELTKLPGPNRPSFRGSIAALFGLDHERLMKEPGDFIHEYKKSAGQLLEEFNDIAIELLKLLKDQSWPKDESKIIELVRESRLLGDRLDKNNRAKRQLISSLSYISEELVPKLLDTKNEIEHLVKGLNGRFVPPGASGCPTKGDHKMLPTGNNFYSVDPQKIPTKEAWEIGKRLGDALIERYVKDHGTYPKQLGIIIWGSPTMRTGGDDVAEALYLMGVRPVWHKSTGNVTGLDIIDLDELKRPRIDVTIRTSGFFRDAFSNLMELLDQAARMVAALNEPPDKNFLAFHVTRDIKELMKEGLSEKEARELSCIRVFSDKPGTYGAGINALLDSSRWNETKDLGEVWIDWGGYGYGKDIYGKRAHKSFRTQLSRVDATIKNQDSRELDILSSDDFNAYHGGLNAAVLAASGKRPVSYSGDSSNPNNLIIRSTDEEMRFVFRARVLNQKWIKAMMEHGYKGAGDLSRLVDIAFQWDATSDVMDDWMYEELAKNYALDKEMQEFFKKYNPDALLNISERLLEAIKRGMWQASSELEQELTELYLQMEAELEGRDV